MEKIQSNGALIDNRPESEKDLDYKKPEAASATAIIPFEHPKVTKLTATVYSQEYVGSCVPHGFYTQLEYEKIVPLTGMSQLRAYRKRSNYPEAGSIAVDMYQQIRGGQNVNSDFPTPKGMIESQATAMPRIEGNKIISDFNYFYIPDYKNVPSTVASGKAVAIFIYATNEEWSQEYVTIKDPNLDINTAYVRHCVCLVPSGDFTENGVEWLTVHDSAKFGGLHLRYISKDFLLKRCFYASQVFPVVEPPVTQKPKHTFKVDLVYGMRGEEVSWLQKCLVWEGLLKPQYVTGFFGDYTMEAAMALQSKYKKEILVPAGSKVPTGKVLKYTRLWLNKNYG